MAAPFVVACTHCGSKLKLKDESFAGKKIRCPKCQQPFVAAAADGAASAGDKAKKPAKARKEFDFSNISEDDYEPPPPAEGEEPEEEFELPLSPVKKAALAGKKGKKKKRRASSGPPLGKIALIAGLVVLGLATVGGVGYGVYMIAQSLGGGGGRLAWLPEDVEIVVEVRPADLWKSQVLQPLTSGPTGTEFANRMRESMKLSVTDVDRVVVGSAARSRTPVVVVYAKTPFEIAEVQKNTTPTDHGGYTLYVDRGGTMAGFLPNSKTLVFGPTAQLKTAIDRKGVCPAADKFSFLPSRGHIVFGTNSPARSVGGPAMPVPAPVDWNSVQSVGAALTFSSDIAVEFAVACNDGSGAEAMVGNFEKTRTETLSKIEAQKGQLQPNPFIDVEKVKAMIEGQRQILESMSVTSSGSTVNGRVTVPGQIVRDAVDAFGTMMPMMMQGFGGAGGAPPPSFAPPANPSEGSP